MDATTISRVLSAQRQELTEHLIYERLAARVSNPHNAAILARIGADEKNHHDFLQGLSGRPVSPRRRQVWFYVVLARLLGITFALKLMERGEGAAQEGYRSLGGVEGIERIIDEEVEHERALIDMLHDEPLAYAGSIVLGLNDALVELTGALAGLTLALADTRLVAMAGLITGIAASLSMASSEYLSSKSEHLPGSDKSPLRAAAYTGAAYVLAVLLLIVPYFVIPHLLFALGAALAIAVAIIAAFTFYISVAKDLRFWPRFWEMTLISLGVAAISFVIGWGIRRLLGVDV